MKMYNRNKVETVGHRYEFVPNDGEWPEWSKIMVGVGDGFEAFEDESDYKKWMPTYKKWEKKWLKEQEEIKLKKIEEEDRVGKIGFFS